MVKIKEQLLCFIVLVISSTIAQEEGDGCIYTRTGSSGTCMQIRGCAVAIADLRRSISPQICGFSGNVPIVCCTNGGPSPPLPPPPPTTTTKTTTTTTRRPVITLTSPGGSPSGNGCPPLPAKALKNAQKTGQKSWDYCVDLANTIFRCKNSILIGGPREREELCSHYVESLVVGGVPAGLNEFPHMALLGYGDASDKAVWECGGTLINKRWVMTAAHCLYSRSAGSEVKFVRLGSPEVNARLDRRMLFDITQIVEHPDRSGQNPPQQYNDIALLQLDRDATFGLAVIPACLHSGPPADIKKAVITGWGVTKSKGAQSNVLQKVTLEEFDHTTCSAAHPPSVRSAQGVINETQICYGSRTEIKDSCQGDSGGPMQIQNKNVYCAYTIVGVVSVGKGCANPGIPGIYTRVSAYIPWIESVAWP